MKNSLKKTAWAVTGVIAICLLIRWYVTRNGLERVADLGPQIPAFNGPQAYSFTMDLKRNRFEVKRAVRQQRGIELEPVANVALPAGFHMAGTGFADPVRLVQTDPADPGIYVILEKGPARPAHPPDVSITPHTPAAHSTIQPYQPVIRETRLCRITPGGKSLEIVASSPRLVSTFAMTHDTAYWVDPQPEPTLKSYPYGSGSITLPEPRGSLVATDLRTLKSRTFRTAVPSRVSLALSGNGVCIQDDVVRPPYKRTWYFQQNMAEPVAVGFYCRPPVTAAGAWLYWVDEQFEWVGSAVGKRRPAGADIDIFAQRMDSAVRKTILHCHSGTGSVQHEIAEYQGHAYAILSNIVGNEPGSSLYLLDPERLAGTYRLTSLPNYQHLEKLSGGWLYYVAREPRENAEDGSAAEYARYRYRLPYR